MILRAAACPRLVTWLVPVSYVFRTCLVRGGSGDTLEIAGFLRLSPPSPCAPIRSANFTMPRRPPPRWLRHYGDNNPRPLAGQVKVPGKGSESGQGMSMSCRSSRLPFPVADGTTGQSENMTISLTDPFTTGFIGPFISPAWAALVVLLSGQGSRLPRRTARWPGRLPTAGAGGRIPQTPVPPPASPPRR